jgi:hypothetical protein
MTEYAKLVAELREEGERILSCMEHLGIPRGLIREFKAADAIESLQAKLAEVRQVGWFATGAKCPDGSDSFVFIACDHDPRESHDNGKPYYRAIAALAPKEA